jgi:hypothetical protein
MPAQPARKRARGGSRDVARSRRSGTGSAAVSRAARLERLRRERHLRRLRRDLLMDFALGSLLTILIISVTAGLGVVALLEIPVAGAVIGSFAVERAARRRRRLSGR